MLTFVLIKLLGETESFEFDATSPVGQDLSVRLTFLQNQVVHLPQLRDSMYYASMILYQSFDI